MFRFEQIRRSKSKKDALEILRQGETKILAGGTYLKFTKKKTKTALDISNLGLDYIQDNGVSIDIGAMSTLRSLETSKIITDNFDGILSNASSCILGVQFRNLATIGGAVISKSGFSNLITCLLSLQAKLVFLSGKTISMEKFLSSKIKEDILEKIVIKKDFKACSFQIMQNTALDLATLNIAVAKSVGKINIAVGARPQVAQLAKEAAIEYSKSGDIKKTITIALKELVFQSNLRASQKYRVLLCDSLMTKALMEVGK